MASSRTKSAPLPRPTKKSRGRRSAAQAASVSRRRSRSVSTKAPAKAVPVAKLPAWSDLSASKANTVKQKREAKPGLVDGVPTLRFAVLLVAACALFTLYVGHVYATQDLVAEVQQLQKEKLRLVLKHNRLRGEFDRMTAPSVILDRAAALGLEPGSQYGPTILLNSTE
ncbi:MAG: hypothetical protein ABJF88_09370 [Rhodothermales bacterium]